MLLSNVWMVLSLIAAVLMAVASAAGILSCATYGRETVTWAAQGTGQDFVNLLIVFPVLVITAIRAHLGNAGARLVWIGALMYVAYSYVLYAFFVHFGPWFLVYVAVLGTSVYALAGALSQLKVPETPLPIDADLRARGAAAFLMLFGCGFAALWLSDVVPALIAGRTPASVTESGFSVNPVHVLDLALALPGIIATSVLLWRRRPTGALFAVPVLVFAVMMGLAIVAMALEMRAQGLPAPLGILPVIVTAVLCSAAFARLLLHAQTDPRASARAIPTANERFR